MRVRGHIAPLANHGGQSVGILDGGWRLHRAREIVVHEAQFVGQFLDLFWPLRILNFVFQN